MSEIFKKLSKIDCSKHVEKKGQLSYLSWTWAWQMLVENYPNSRFEFLPDDRLPDGSVMVACTVTVDDVSRSMWLPVMDNRNNAIMNPDARKISDARMRCLVKCIALHGLGLYIYAGEDLPQVDPQDAVKEYEALCKEFDQSILAIKLGIANNDLSSAAEAWAELSEETKLALWKAPTKGGCFTTQERAVMKSTEFRLARGEQ